MRENKVIFICMLIYSMFVCPKSFGQTNYTYEKGKPFTNTNALLMTNMIDLTSISSPIPYKKSIPGQIQTIACPIQLPKYVRGIFFSRDSRPGDFEWSNNINRLLPWVPPQSHTERMGRHRYTREIPIPGYCSNHLFNR